MFTLIQRVYKVYSNGTCLRKAKGVIANCTKTERFNGVQMWKNISIKVPLCPPSGMTNDNRMKVVYTIEVLYNFFLPGG